uniref:GPS domain-containing protein n=1 Tax=Macrostomum lignano TaxID=282301 RepID=A0A1I8FKE0_9PLAT
EKLELVFTGIFTAECWLEDHCSGLRDGSERWCQLNHAGTWLRAAAHIALPRTVLSILIYAIIGLEMFSGKLHGACYKQNHVTRIWTIHDDAQPCDSRPAEELKGWNCIGVDYQETERENWTCFDANPSDKHWRPKARHH